MMQKFSYPPPSSHHDKRYVPRWQVNNRVQFAVDQRDKVHQGYTKDISCAGACLQLDSHSLLIQQKINLTIYLSDTASVQVKGQVAWINPKEDGCDVGVSFCDVSDKVQATLLDYAFEVNRQGIVNHWFKDWDGQPQ